MDYNKYLFIQETGWFEEFTRPEAELAWSIFRTQLAVASFDGLVFVLPRLSDHSFYRPYFVLLKKRKTLLKQLLFAESSSYQPAGQLLSLVTEITRQSYESITADIEVDTSWRCCTLKRRYHEKREGVEKLIDITLSKVKKLKCPPLQAQTIRVNTDTLAAMLNNGERPKTIMVIQAVYVAENAKMDMRCGDEIQQWRKKDFVVGFETWRYSVTSDGRLEAAMLYIRPQKIKIDYWRAALDIEWPDEKHKAKILDADVLSSNQSEVDGNDENSSENEKDKNKN